MMNRRNWLASAGLVFVAVWVIGLVIQSDTPSPAVSAAELTAYFRAHQQGQLIQTFLFDGIAGISLIVFAAVVKNIFRTVDSVGATWVDVIGGGRGRQCVIGASRFQ